MKYSEKLNGYWEEGYHYYLEFRDDKLTVRGYDKGVRIETTVSYDADKLDTGERTVITLENNILSRDCEGNMMTEIKELACENGELKMLYYYTIMGETLYTLKKVDGGPFRNIIIRDDEFLDKLQGEWVQWRSGGKSGTPIIIEGSSIRWIGEAHKFHVVSYTYAKDDVYIVPEDLIRKDFGGYTAVKVYPDKLETRMMVYDMSVPVSVFARKDMLDKIDIPDDAKTEPRSTMMMDAPKERPSAPNMVFFAGMGSPGIAPIMGAAGMVGMGMAGMMSQSGKNAQNTGYKTSPMNDPARIAEITGVCPMCGYKLGGERPKFCPGCGANMEK